MTKALIPLALLLALGACNKEDHTIVAGPNVDDGNDAVPANVVLPPAIKATKTYRCADSSVVRVDWLADDKSATVTPDKGSPIAVSADEAGKPMTAADGTTLSGTAEAGSAKIGVGGKAAQTCNG